MLFLNYAPLFCGDLYYVYGNIRVFNEANRIYIQLLTSIVTQFKTDLHTRTLSNHDIESDIMQLKRDLYRSIELEYEYEVFATYFF